MVKKNYLYLFVLLFATIVVTLLLSFLYKKEVDVVQNSYAYNKLNKITSSEFEEYMMEHPDAIIYISDKLNLENNKFEKKLIKKLEKLNLLENVIYVEKCEVNSDLKKIFYENYSYKYNDEELPIIIVIIEGKLIQTTIVNKNSIIDEVINYELFE